MKLIITIILILTYVVNTQVNSFVNEKANSVSNTITASLRSIKVNPEFWLKVANAFDSNKEPTQFVDILTWEKDERYKIVNLKKFGYGSKSDATYVCEENYWYDRTDLESFNWNANHPCYQTESERESKQQSYRDWNAKMNESITEEDLSI